MSHPLFGTAFRRGPDQPADLSARIDQELRSRLEEAVDFACLEALVERRRARGLPGPVADSAADRAEYTGVVRAFLAHLAEMTETLTGEPRAHAEAARTGPGDEVARMVAVQVVLARALPDYWQRFEQRRDGFAASYRTASEPLSGSPESGRDPRGLLARLFGRG